MIAMQLVGLYTVYFTHINYLKLCQNQSEFDLSCLSYMKSIALHNSWIRRCNVSMEEEIEGRDFTINSIKVSCKDHDTFVESVYQKNGNTITMRLYYDESGLLDFEYV